MPCQQESTADVGCTGPESNGFALRPPKSISYRLTVPLAAILIAIGGFQAYLTATSQRNEILSEATLSSLRIANTVRRSTRNAMMHSRREDVHKMIEEIGEQEGIDHVRILNKEGAIVYSSHAEEINDIVDRKAEACYQCHDAEKPLTKLEMSKRTRVFQQGDGHRTVGAIEVIRNEPSCWSAECHAHPKEKTILGVVDIGVSLKDADARVAGSTRNAVVVALTSTALICVLVGFLINRFVSHPVKRLLQCTQKVARGDLNCCLELDGNDEMAHLARGFRKMTDDLRIAHAERSQWALQLEEEVENKTRDLKLAQAQVVRSEKLSSIGLLAAGVAHELNSPLTGILTFAHLLAKRAPDDTREKKDLEIIIGETERCATIIRQLLDFSRESSPEMRRQDLHTVLQQAIALVERQALFHNIKLELNFDLDLPPVLMDPGQIQQVFLNLLVNAGESMPGGGQLMIETSKMSSTDSQHNGAFNIVFRDTGMGIPPENIDKVFDPFFTSKDVGQGTGLGLAVSYGIIERHGGTVRVESTLGKGSTFIITLPTGSSENRSP